MFFWHTYSLGIEIGKETLLLSVVRTKGKVHEVIALKEFSEVEELNSFCLPFAKAPFISAIKARDLLMRSCELELKKEKDISAALEFHVEPMLPYALDKAIMQHEVLEKRAKSTLLNVSVVRKDHLIAHLDALKSQELEPEKVISRPHALAALSQHMGQGHGCTLIVYDDEDELIVVLADRGELLGFRSSESGQGRAIELQKALLSLSQTHKQKPFDAVCFLSKDLNLKAALQKLTDKPFIPLSSPSIALTPDEWLKFGLTIGMALSGSQVNFRTKELAYPHPFKRIKLPLALYYSLTIVTSILLFFLSKQTLEQKKEEFGSAFLLFLKNEGKEPSLLPQNPEEFVAAIDLVEQELYARPKTFPLLPQVPKVKEVMSWIASFADAKDTPVTIESIHYQMVMRPDFSAPQEKYRIRMEVEWSTPHPSAAKAFQEALKADTLMVDGSQEMQWSQNRGKYKACFYLKDKTRYV